jgi:hypothetical protein
MDPWLSQAQGSFCSKFDRNYVLCKTGKSILMKALRLSLWKPVRQIIKIRKFQYINLSGIIGLFYNNIYWLIGTRPSENMSLASYNFKPGAMDAAGMDKPLTGFGIFYMVFPDV